VTRTSPAGRPRAGPRLSASRVRPECAAGHRPERDCDASDRRPHAHHRPAAAAGVCLSDQHDARRGDSAGGADNSEYGQVDQQRRRRPNRSPSAVPVRTRAAKARL
jgi:hypothetical protein